MSTYTMLTVQQAKETLEDYIRFFEQLDADGISYCLVGGLGVMVQALAGDSTRLRLTQDADILIPASYSNQDMAREYLNVYATSPDTSAAIYDFMFGEGTFDLLAEEDQAYINMSFVGPEQSLEGFESPSFDICRQLNGKTFDSIERERVQVGSHTLTVATVPELLDMKRTTVGLLKALPSDSSRGQDFIDIETLEELLAQDDTSGAAESLSTLRQLFRTVVRSQR